MAYKQFETFLNTVHVAYMNKETTDQVISKIELLVSNVDLRNRYLHNKTQYCWKLTANRRSTFSGLKINQ
ncbi:hypothetical protein GCM10011511_15560 [Puia dinghuensis]|uniref:Uncharacterized protein n=1 Tax=Puia dinghuensis TaxID=1792502 RepID=A0A8J2XQH1_9BACT|nr:hypothetical protein GCM10011511_15560 [Puia dinghuensis]